MLPSGQKCKVCIAVRDWAVENGKVNRANMKFLENPERRTMMAGGLLALTALMMVSCASVGGFSPSSVGDRDYPIYTVMAERTPFYLKDSPTRRGAKDHHAYVYLSKGMTVTMLKNEAPYSKVSLINGMVGWMPIAVLAPQMSTGETDGSSAVSPATSQEPSSPTPPLAQDLSPSGASNSPPRKPVKMPSYY